MAKEYAGFPIANFRTGFNEALEPWLIPRDAFQVLKNAHLYRGVVERISGYNIFTRMSYRSMSTLDGVVDGVNTTFTTTLPSVPTTGNTTIQATIDAAATITEVFTDDGNGNLTSNSGGTGTINYVADFPVVGQPAGYVTVTFSTAPVVLTGGVIQYNNVLIFYDHETGIDPLTTDPDIMGIKQFININGSQDVLIFDTRRVGKVVELTGDMSTLQQLDYGVQELPHEVQELIESPFGNSVGPVVGDVADNLIPGMVRFEIYDSSSPTANLLGVITDNGATKLVGDLLDPAGQNYINYITGRWRMQFLVARNTSQSMKFSACTYGDTFTGDFTNFFDVVNYQGNAFITNAVDPPMYYDGSCVKYLNTNQTLIPNSIAPYNISRVLHLAVQRERLLLISAYQDGIPALNTIFWSVAGDPLDFTNGEYLPAPTSQSIKTTSEINTDLIVRFTNSERVFRYTSDAFSPFRWDSTNSLWRCDASFSAINYDSWFSSVGLAAIVGSDGVNVTRADEIIPDFTLNLRIDEQMPVPSMSQTSIGQCYGERFDDFKEGWLCYRSYDQENSGIQKANNVLAFSYLDGTYSIYTFPFSVLGYGRIIAEDTWVNNYDTWQSAGYTWDSYSETQGALINLAGDHNGNVYKLGGGTKITNMDGTVSNCLFEAITKDFNPYVESGELARFGYIDFLVSSNDATKFRVQFYTDNKMDADFDTYYQETTLELPGNGQSKIWKRIYTGAVGKEHTMRIYQSEDDFDEETRNQPIRIHAMIPYFKPAGRIFG